MNIINSDEWFKKITNECLQYYLPETCRGGICIDIGANVGGFVNAFSSRFDKFICFEPCLNNFSLLKNNTKKFSHVLLNNLAVDKESNLTKKLMYFKTDQGIDYFGNSGNCSTIPEENELLHGWSKKMDLKK